MQADKAIFAQTRQANARPIKKLAKNQVNLNDVQPPLDMASAQSKS